MSLGGGQDLRQAGRCASIDSWVIQKNASRAHRQNARVSVWLEMAARLATLRRHLATTSSEPASALPQQQMGVELTPTSGPKLLTDQQMQDFIREGFAMYHLDDLPASYHEGVIDTLDKVFERYGNPGNNMLCATLNPRP